VELSSQGFNRLILFGVGFWWPTTKGMENWEEGKRIGAVSLVGAWGVWRPRCEQHVAEGAVSQSSWQLWGVVHRCLFSSTAPTPCLLYVNRTA
jgi:hypothetical protein